jgi:hypothetical protein
MRGCGVVLASVVLLVPAAASAAVLPHGLGLIPTPAAQASPRAIAQAVERAASLPSSASLTAYAIAPGNQGEVGSCAAWSSDYTALGYWENKEGIPGAALEPMYTYSQVDGGVDGGSSIEANLSIDEQQGIDTQSDYWQGNFDYVDQPTAAEQANAVNWKLSGYADLTIDPGSSSTVTQTSIETAIAAGDPVVIGIPVYDNFFDVGAADDGYYASPSGNFDGYHAIAALGYNSQGLVIENSWGTDWGDGGYATLSWSFVNTYVLDAVSVGPLVVGQPVSGTAPSVTGAAQVGQTLAAAPGTWSPTATSYSYQWESAPAGSGDWSMISGATSASYTVAAGAAGEELRVLVTAGNGTGAGAAVSATLGPVGASSLVNTTAPRISGTLLVGQTLTASTGTWAPTPTSYAYQWQRSINSATTWTNINAATTSTYTTTSADAGADERVVVTATATNASASADSNAVGPISGAPQQTTAPTVTGTAQVGQTLTASTGTWSPAGTSYAYQWQRSPDSGATWTNISAATASTYVAQATDAGAQLRVQVTAGNAVGTATAASAATSAVTIAGVLVDSTAPVISGTAARGLTLTVSNATWSPTPTSYAYAWQSSTNDGQTWTPISGATASTYIPAKTDEGAQLRGVVTATNGATSATAASAPTAQVRSNPPQVTLLPELNGPAIAVGVQLSATNGIWRGAENTYTYQWQRGTSSIWTTWTNIVAATATTYTATSADTGHRLRVLVTATNPDASASAASQPTAVVPTAVAPTAVAPTAVVPTAKANTVKLVRRTSRRAATNPTVNARQRSRA